MHRDKYIQLFILYVNYTRRGEVVLTSSIYCINQRIKKKKSQKTLKCRKEQKKSLKSQQGHYRNQTASPEISTDGTSVTGAEVQQKQHRRRLTA